jgi:hypothetical protein
MSGQGLVVELALSDGGTAVQIECHTSLIPRPGQYVMAHDGSLHSPLASQLLPARYVDRGFVAAPPAPMGWRPGTRIQIRGPLGRGFRVPPGSKRIAFVALDSKPAVLLALYEELRSTGAAFSLVCDDALQDLPYQLEVHPLRSLPDVCAWSDYVAMEMVRESGTKLKEHVLREDRLITPEFTQILVRTPMPCGDLAECGVCTVRTPSGAQLVCHSGPVFDIGRLIGKIQ